jgi:hypothetical protein
VRTSRIGPTGNEALAANVWRNRLNSPLIFRSSPDAASASQMFKESS